MENLPPRDHAAIRGGTESGTEGGIRSPLRPTYPPRTRPCTDPAYPYPLTYSSLCPTAGRDPYAVCMRTRGSGPRPENDPDDDPALRDATAIARRIDDDQAAADHARDHIRVEGMQTIAL